MREVHEYHKYKARLRQRFFWLLPRRLWAKWVRIARWTYYERERLVRKFEEQFWPTECRGGALNAEFEILGWDEDEDSAEPVSEWWRVELRRADAIAEAVRRGIGRAGENIESGRPGRRKGSGVDTLVRHLKDKEEIDDLRDVYQVLVNCGTRRVTEVARAWGTSWLDRIEDAYDRGRTPHSQACPYCGKGLPRGVADAVSRLKSR